MSREKYKYVSYIQDSIEYTILRTTGVEAFASPIQENTYAQTSLRGD